MRERNHFVIPWLKTIEHNGHDAYSVKKLFIQRQQSPGKITQHFHTLDSRQCFVGIKMNMLMKREFSIKDESKISPLVLWLKNRFF